MRWTMPCPHCGTRGIARVKRRTSDLCWNVDFQCDNVLCGRTYRTALTLMPAVTPVPKAMRHETRSLFDDSPEGEPMCSVGEMHSPTYLEGE
jgi:hypothetical protein